MLEGAIDSITKLIQSPPGQIAAGGVLAGIVWKFFERVETVLTDKTKLEIAVWLLDIKTGPKVEPWPETFAKVFDRVFGTEHLSWQCLLRSFVLSCFAFAVGLVFTEAGRGSSIGQYAFFTVSSVLLFTALPDYVSLLKTRTLIGKMRRGWKHTSLLLVLDIVGAACIFGVFTLLYIGLYLLMAEAEAASPLLGYPLLLVAGSKGVVLIPPLIATSIWLWLYAGSGFLIKVARRFDIGFDWFNRHADIEKKPLQSIGFVAGALVALVYWSAVIVSRMVK